MAGHRLGALKGGTSPPFQCTPGLGPWPFGPEEGQTGCRGDRLGDCCSPRSSGQYHLGDLIRVDMNNAGIILRIEKVPRPWGMPVPCAAPRIGRAGGGGGCGAGPGSPPNPPTTSPGHC